MRRVNRLSVHEVNSALYDLDRRINQLRGGAGPVALHGELDLKGRVITGSGQATRETDLVTKQHVADQIEINTTTIINQASGSVWVRLNQSLTGTKDGVNTTFTVPSEVFNEKLEIYHQHVRLQKVDGLPGVRQFRLTGTTVLLGTAPASSDHLVCDFLSPRPTSPVFDEIPTGTKNGANTSFTLAYEPTAAADVAVYVGGALFQRVDASPAPDEYTLVGQALEMGAAPLATDPFYIDYPVSVPGDVRWNDQLAGDKNGSNTVFELDEEPSNNEIGIYMSHIRLKEVASPTLPTEYKRTGTTVTVGMAPASTEPLYAHYVTPRGGRTLHAGPGWVIGTSLGDCVATTLADMSVLAPEGLNGFMGGQN